MTPITIITTTEKHYLTSRQLMVRHALFCVARGFGGMLALLWVCQGTLGAIADRITVQQSTVNSLIAERDQYRSIAEDVGRSCGQQMIRAKAIVEAFKKGKPPKSATGIGGPE